MRHIPRAASASLLNLVLLCSIPAFAQPPTSTPAPATAWERAIPAGIEWARLTHERGRLVIASRTAEICVIDASTGAALTAAPLQAGRGVRLVEDDDTRRPATPPGSALAEPVFLFDRHALYALTPGSTGWTWVYGEPARASAAYPDDPEFLTGWVAANRARAGLIAVDSAGFVECVDAGAGVRRWRVELGGRLAGVRLHVCGDVAAVLWRAGGSSRAALIDLRDGVPAAPDSVTTAQAGVPAARDAFPAAQGGVPAIRSVDPGREAPLWSALAPEGLVIVGARAIHVWSRAGTSYDWADVPDDLQARGVALWVPADGTSSTSDPAGSPRGHSVLLIASADRLTACALPDGREVWQAPLGRAATTAGDQPASPRSLDVGIVPKTVNGVAPPTSAHGAPWTGAEGMAPIERLDVVGDFAIACSAARVVAFDVRSGARLAAIASPPGAAVVSAWTDGTVLWALLATPSDDAGHGTGSSGLTLAAQPLDPAPLGDSRPAELRTIAFGALRGVHWTPGVLVLVGTESARGVKLESTKGLKSTKDFEGMRRLGEWGDGVGGMGTGWERGKVGRWERAARTGSDDRRERPAMLGLPVRQVRVGNVPNAAPHPVPVH